MEISVSTEIESSPNAVWPVLIDVERWPEWTPSISRVERLDRSPFGMGTRVRIYQPKLKTMVWQVSEFKPGRQFIWEARSRGIFVVASHEIQAIARGASVVMLNVRQTGWLSPVVHFLFSDLTRRYMRMEAEGLKH